MIEKINQGIELEIREDERLGPMLHAVILQEGRAASGGRSELFVPGSSTWPESGIEIKIGHGGQVETLAHPVRSPEGGEIRIAVRTTDRITKSVQEGTKGMSVEFFALAESRAGAVREIERALISGAALVSSPEYQQAKAEVRAARGGRRRLWL